MKYIIAIITVICLVFVLFLMKGPSALVLSTYVRPATPVIANLPYGDNTLGIGEIAHFPTITLEPLEVVEDSRCPVNVQCIQAGTVRVRLSIASSAGTTTDILEVGKTLTESSTTITFVSVSPEKTAPAQISPNQYRFVLNVTKTVPVPGPISAGGCYRGGCSGEVCSDQKGIVSNCIYKEAFACYSTASCERQTDGSCGWTPTPSLNICLQNAK